MGSRAEMGSQGVHVGEACAASGSKLVEAGFDPEVAPHGIQLLKLHHQALHVRLGLCRVAV